MIKIIGVGDNTIDTYVHQRMRFPGGNAVNVAVLARQYGYPAAYLGWLGNDDRGRLLLDSLRDEDVDISRCRVVDDLPTGYSEVFLVDGDRVFGQGDSGACVLIDLTDEDLAYIRGFDIVHTSVFSFLEGQIEQLKSVIGCLSFDLSQHCAPEYLAAILPHVDIAFFSAAELRNDDLEGLAAHMHALGPSLVVITRGSKGAWVFDGQRFYRQGIIPVETVDTLGAGDAFTARFLVETASGVAIPDAMRAAAHSAAQNCTHYGAFGHGQPYSP